MNVRPGLLKIPVDRQFIPTDVEFAVNSTESGFGRVSRVGVSVQLGITATLNYDINVTAISSRTLSTLDAEFERSLNETEREQYEAAKRSYNGGLRVPFLRFVGINLGASSSRETMTRASERLSEYNTKSRIVRDVLETTQEERLNINGEIRATGVSFIPTQGFAFIQVATIEFNDGSTKLAVTADPSETSAATIDGATELPANDDDKDLNVIPLLGE